MKVPFSDFSWSLAEEGQSVFLRIDVCHLLGFGVRTASLVHRIREEKNWLSKSYLLFLRSRVMRHCLFMESKITRSID
jgi:hypothetical protein